MSKGRQPKAKDRDHVRLLVEVLGEMTHRTSPRGTRGAVIESYQEPTEGCSVDLVIPGNSLDDELEYDTVVLKPEQFEVIPFPCLLRIHTALAPADLVGRLAELTAGRAQGTEVTTNSSVLSLIRDRRADPAVTPRHSADFRYELWADALPTVPLEPHVATIAAVLEGLWSDGVPAVALCDFAHRLPDEGGRRWEGDDDRRKDAGREREDAEA